MEEGTVKKPKVVKIKRALPPQVSHREQKLYTEGEKGRGKNRASEWVGWEQKHQSEKGVGVALVFLGLGIVERQWRKACKRIQDLNMVKLRKCWSAYIDSSFIFVFLCFSLLFLTSLPQHTPSDKPYHYYYSIHPNFPLSLPLLHWDKIKIKKVVCVCVRERERELKSTKGVWLCLS